MSEGQWLVCCVFDGTLGLVVSTLLGLTNSCFLYLSHSHVLCIFLGRHLPLVFNAPRLVALLATVWFEQPTTIFDNVLGGLNSLVFASLVLVSYSCVSLWRPYHLFVALVLVVNFLLSTVLSVF